jgi:hypothetical protein
MYATFGNYKTHKKLFLNLSQYHFGYAHKVKFYNKEYKKAKYLTGTTNQCCVSNVL